MTEPGAAAEHQHDRIVAEGKGLDYEQEALAGLARSWILTDPTCQALALQDAQAWALLHLARVNTKAAGAGTEVTQ